MKLENHIDPKKEKIEVSIEQQKEVEQFVFRGVLKPKPNQRVFKLDLYKGFVSEVLFYSESNTINFMDIVYGDNEYKDRKIIIEEGFDYLIALNIKNALKHFKKRWSELEICVSEEHVSNTLKKKQKEVKLFSSQ